MFYQNYAALDGSIVARDNEEQVRNAITLHPYKDHRYIYDTAQYLYMNKLTKLKEKLFIQVSDISAMDILIKENRDSDIDYMDTWLKESDSNLSRTDIPFWSSFDKCSIYLHSIFNEKSSSKPPKNTLERHHLNVLLKRVIEKDKQRKYYGSAIYQTINPRHGADTIVQVKVCCFHHKPRRRQFLIHQAYSKIETHEGKGGILVNETPYLDSITKVNFIIPLSGRTETFGRFMENFEMSFLRHKENVSLFIILYKDQRKEQHSDIFLVSNLVQNLKENYPQYRILLIQKIGSFHRGVALQEASEFF